MLQRLLEDYGYLALFLGTYFEGETILVLAGFLAYREYLELWMVILVAFIGSYAGDQTWFYLGRWKGNSLLERKPKLKLLADKALRYLNKYPDLWVLSFRFVYGLRTVMPVAIGMSGYPPLRYLVLNGIGAAIWATVLGYTSYIFGAVLEEVLGDIKRYELTILGTLVVVGLLVWGIRRWRHRRARLNATPPSDAQD
ncbi:DedA family protein [Isoalcanivorax beigongshangi]|uniref:DedA family protein n=1 Tax=Isoalcanivorax beigongshangi TaxID=3238810 RepID=A0ABV4AGB3_9GAMM